MKKLANLFGLGKPEKKKYVSPSVTVVDAQLETSILVASAMGNTDIGGEDIIWEDDIIID